VAASSAEPTLEETIAQLDATLESTRDGIAVVTLDRRILRFNRQLADMFRLTPNDLEQRPPADIISDIAQQLEDSDAMRLRSDELWTNLSAEYLAQLRFKDGRVFERFVAPLRIGATIAGRVVSYRDITRAVTADRALRIAHDLNNALTAISGHAELALAALDAEAPARSDVEEIRRAASRAASITRQLLAFSRK